MIGLLLLLAGCTRNAGPNLLMISVDTLRADRLGAYGYTRPTSPNIDKLATEGQRFTRMISPRGATRPALMTLQTSLPPVLHGSRQNSALGAEGLPTLATLLTGQGYQTAAILANGGELPWPGFAQQVTIKRAPRDPATADEAIAILEKARAPFYVWVHLMAPHAPYDPHPGEADFRDPGYTGPIDGSNRALLAGMSGNPAFTQADLDQINARYDAEVAHADRQVGRLLAALEQSGQRADTLVVLTADHGEQLGNPAPYLYHFASGYDAVLHVPLVLSQPGRIPVGVATETVALQDLAPTVADLLGVSAPSTWMGRSLRPAFSGGDLPDRAAISEVETGALIATHDIWAYSRNPNNKGFDFAPTQNYREEGLDPTPPLLRMPDRRLWRLDQDPHQTKAAENEAVKARLEAELQTFIRQTGWPGTMDRGVVPAELREQLERLGYSEAGPR